MVELKKQTGKGKILIKILFHKISASAKSIRLVTPVLLVKYIKFPYNF